MGILNRIGLVALSTLLASGAALAQDAPEAPAHKGPKAPHRAWQDLPPVPLRPFTAPKAERHELANGVVVWLMEDHELPTLDLVTLVKTGSVYEPREKAGLASICGEVMRSGGAGKHSGDELDRMLEDMAASVEVGISTTEARASLSCLKEQFDRTLPVLMDVLERPQFDEKKIALAKRQAKNAIGRRNDDPSGIARREFSRIMYGDDSPFGWTTEVSTIDAITKADLVRFHGTYFGIPQSTIVGVVGDFEPKAMLEKLEASFGKWEKAEGVIAMPPVGLSLGGDGPAPKVYFVRKPDVNQATVILGHMGEQRKPTDPDYAPLIVLNSVLGGGGFASRLLQHVRTDMGLAYGVGSRWNAPYAYKGTFSLSGQTKSQSTLQMIAAIRHELDLVCKEPVGADELKVAKDSIAQEMIFENDAREKVLERALRYEYYGYPQDYLEKFTAAIAAVTAEDCLRAAKAHWKPEKLVTFVVGNDADFDKPLASLGQEVVEVDVEKPAFEPKGGAAAGEKKAAEADPKALEKGRALVEKALAAKGGRAALEGVKSVRVAGKGTRMTQMGPMPEETVKLIAFPDRVRVEMTTQAGKVVLVAIPGAAWAETPEGTQDLPDSFAKNIRDQAVKEQVAVLLALAKPEAKAAYLGTEKVDGGDELEILDAGAGMKLYVDKDGHLVRRVEKTPEGVYTTIWSDFRSVNGIAMPFASKVLMGDEQILDMTATSVEVNVDVPADAFKKPAEAPNAPGGKGDGSKGGPGGR